MLPSSKTETIKERLDAMAMEDFEVLLKQAVRPTKQDAVPEHAEILKQLKGTHEGHGDNPTLSNVKYHSSLQSLNNDNPAQQTTTPITQEPKGHHHPYRNHTSTLSTINSTSSLNSVGVDPAPTNLPLTYFFNDRHTDHPTAVPDCVPDPEKNSVTLLEIMEGLRMKSSALPSSPKLKLDQKKPVEDSIIKAKSKPIPIKISASTPDPDDDRLFGIPFSPDPCMNMERSEWWKPPGHPYTERVKDFYNTPLARKLDPRRIDEAIYPGRQIFDLAESTNLFPLKRQALDETVEQYPSEMPYYRNAKEQGTHGVITVSDEPLFPDKDAMEKGSTYIFRPDQSALEIDKSSSGKKGFFATNIVAQADNSSVQMSGDWKSYTSVTGGPAHSTPMGGDYYSNESARLNSIVPAITNSQQEDTTERSRRPDRLGKKKNNKNNVREVDVQPDKLPGYRGAEDIESLVQFLEGQSATNNNKKNKKKERLKEKETLVKSASLDENHLNSNAKRSTDEQSKPLKEVEKKSEKAVSSCSISSLPTSQVVPINSQMDNKKKAQGKPNESKRDARKREERDESGERPFELVTKKRKHRKSTTQREAESFSRGQAKEQARREQNRARRAGGERRSSACSAPGSDNSDHSDDDSVRSLPAGECTPRERIPKQCASSGGTPQTSYADIAKVPEPPSKLSPAVSPLLPIAHRIEEPPVPMVTKTVTPPVSTTKPSPILVPQKDKEILKNPERKDCLPAQQRPADDAFMTKGQNINNSSMFKAPFPPAPNKAPVNLNQRNSLHNHNQRNVRNSTFTNRNHQNHNTNAQTFTGERHYLSTVIKTGEEKPIVKDEGMKVLIEDTTEFPDITSSMNTLSINNKSTKTGKPQLNTINNNGEYPKGQVLKLINNNDEKMPHEDVVRVVQPVFVQPAVDPVPVAEPILEEEETCSVEEDASLVNGEHGEESGEEQRRSRNSASVCSSTGGEVPVVFCGGNFEGDVPPNQDVGFEFGFNVMENMTYQSLPADTFNLSSVSPSEAANHPSSLSQSILEQKEAELAEMEIRLNRPEEETIETLDVDAEQEAVESQEVLYSPPPPPPSYEKPRHSHSHREPLLGNYPRISNNERRVSHPLSNPQYRITGGRGYYRIRNGGFPPQQMQAPPQQPPPSYAMAPPQNSPNFGVPPHHIMTHQPQTYTMMPNPNYSVAPPRVPIPGNPYTQPQGQFVNNMGQMLGYYTFAPQPPQPIAVSTTSPMDDQGGQQGLPPLLIPNTVGANLVVQAPPPSVVISSINMVPSPGGVMIPLMPATLDASGIFVGPSEPQPLGINPFLYYPPSNFSIPTPGTEVQQWMDGYVDRTYQLEAQGKLKVHRIE